uniref:DNA topoisomerase I n=1 Tax=Strigamia maritima TaxID=126957 RepID=T1J4Y8_STRMM
SVHNSPVKAVTDVSKLKSNENKVRNDKEKHRSKHNSDKHKEKSKHHKDPSKHGKSKEGVKDEKKHKDVHNSSVKTKDSNSSPGSLSKVKENSLHTNSHKESVSKAKENITTPQVAKIKLKLNNSTSSISIKSESSSTTSSPVKGSESSKVKTKESHSVNKVNSTSSSSKADKTKVPDKSGHKKEHKRKENERDKHDEKKDEAKVQKEKENRGKGNVDGSKISKSKVHHKEKQEQNLKVKSKAESDMGLGLTVRVKDEEVSDDDVALASRITAPVVTKTEPTSKPTPKSKQNKKRVLDSDSDEEPLSARLSKPKKQKLAVAKKRKADDDSDDEPILKKVKKETIKNNKKSQPATQEGSPKKRGKKDEGQDVWKWWEEEKYDNGIKWKTLIHKGPVFAPDYEPVPDSVQFSYDGKVMKLQPKAEEVASFYAKMLDHDYTTKDAFNKNFFKDWRKTMTERERETITDLKKCNFTKMFQYFKDKSEERKSMTKEEKLEIKKQNEATMQEYGFCMIDNHKEKIGNFKIEPPGLFRGRGEHPKMGMLKKRIEPENVIINCSKGDAQPKPPKGRKWKEVRHDNSVTWLACWTENIQGQTKYVMLNASSKLKGEKDWGKYEIARKLAGGVDKIRETYRQDFKSKEMKVRQRAVALYFIDKLALRAGNEKEEGETADTVGCCSLRVEHIKLYEEKNGQQHVVEFDFLGKDSVRYQNSVAVEKRVYKNLQIFMERKKPDDDLFDRLNTTTLNKHLNELMDGLTAKVFRTYNASITLQQQLDLLTKEDDSIPAKILSYNRANRAVAILCNHQRSVPKTFDKSMENLQNKITAKKEQIAEVEKEMKKLKRDKGAYEKKKKTYDRLREQLVKLEVQATDKEENKEIALGTSKLNYLDPRISVAWCKKWDVPIEKIYNRTQRDKFRWAIEMAGPDFVF